MYRAYKTSITLTSNDGTRISLGTLKLTVPVSEDAEEDSEAPIITNVNAVKNDDKGSITVSYNATDDSNITNYYIKSCKNNNNSYECSDAVSTLNTSYTYSDLDNGTYKFIVYAEDENGNIASNSEIENANAISGHAMSSIESEYIWTVNINFVLTNIYYDGTNTTGSVEVNYMEEYTVNLTTSRNCPSTITVEMNGQTLTDGVEYTYTRANNRRSATLVFNAQYLIGDVTVTASARG